jgi:hypothetical protein
VELRGPSVADAEQAFARSWRHAGGTVAEEELPTRDSIAQGGAHGVRVIPTTPETAAVFRMDLLVASLARERLWLTDAYFMANVPYVQALRRAAADGVDVRLLLPSTSDIGWIAAASRTMYGALIDGLWTRVGSTNLNAGSWMNNWEMDVSIEDAAIAQQMEARYAADLQNADEIVRSGSNGTIALQARPAPASSRSAGRHKGIRGGVAPTGAGSGAQLLREVGNLGSAVGAAVTGQRPLESFEFRPLITFGTALLLLAALGFWKPHVVFWPIGGVLAALGLQLVVRGIQARFPGRRRRRNST